MRHVLSLVLALALSSVPVQVSAQAPQEAPVVVHQHWECNALEIDRLEAQTDEVWMPLAQELVDEGLFTYVQMLEQDFGDEWNVLWYFRSPDRSTHFRAWSEWIGRIEERYPEEADRWFDACPRLKHAMYRVTAHTELP